MGFQKILVVSCNNITPNNDIMYLLITEEDNDHRGFFEVTMNLDSMEYIDIRQLFNDNLVEIPDGYYFYPSITGPNDTILGQFRDDNWNMYVGRLVPVTNETSGYIHTEFDEYERGETFTATYTLENVKPNMPYELSVNGAKSTFPTEYYNFDDGYCRLIAGQGETTKYWDCYFNKNLNKVEIPIEIDTSKANFQVNYDYVYLRISTSNGDVSAVKKITILDNQVVDEYLEIKNYLSQKYNIPVESISLESKQYVEWKDGCLGIYTKGERCTQAITPGYRLIFITSENTTPNKFSIHTNKSISYWKEGNFLPIAGGTETM